MLVYELLIAVSDGATTAGVVRKRMGDIVAICPRERKNPQKPDEDLTGPIDWGRKEIDQYFIIPIQTVKSMPEIVKFLEGIYFREDTMSAITQAEAGKLDGSEVGVTHLYKNRYSVPLEKLRVLISGFDEIKFKDLYYNYQPLRTADALVKKFTGKDNNCFLTSAMIDCATKDIASEQEVVIDLDNTQSFILDKLTQEYVK